jgi:hypothetical protein
MPHPKGFTSCNVCGLPYPTGTKALHVEKAPHKLAEATAAAAEPKKGKPAVTAGSSSGPVTGNGESFGQRMARIRAEKKAAAG